MKYQEVMIDYFGKQVLNLIGAMVIYRMKQKDGN